jgi:hypothetical protein
MMQRERCIFNVVEEGELPCEHEGQINTKNVLGQLYK